MREWRKEHPLTGEAKKKANARAYTHVYISRGKLKRQPCRVCGDKAQPHHLDYDQPLLVEWLCRKCHLAEHGKMCHVKEPADPRRSAV